VGIATLDFVIRARSLDIFIDKHNFIIGGLEEKAYASTGRSVTSAPDCRSPHSKIACKSCPDRLGSASLSRVHGTNLMP
jgi:hypothetical protein